MIKVYKNETFKNMKLIIIGDMKNKSDKYINQVYNECLKNPNILPQGYINNNEINDFYHISNIQIVPSICKLLKSTKTVRLSSPLLPANIAASQT